MSEVFDWMKDAFLDLEDSDVVIVFRDATRELRIPAHRFVLLRNQSSVLRKMLNECPFKEGTSGVMELLGVDPRVGVHFVEFLYLRSIPGCSEMELIMLIKAGDMYDLPKLVTLCDQKLVKKLNTDNCVFIYETLCVFREGPNQTKYGCLNMMATNKEFFTQKRYLGLVSETFEQLLQREVLYLSEADLVRALWEWGKQQCSLKGLSRHAENVESELQSLAKNIRWRFVSKAKTIFPPELCEYIDRMKKMYDGEEIFGGDRTRQPPQSVDRLW